MEFPPNLTIVDAKYFLDGGTICLTATDPANHCHTIILLQHMFPEPWPESDARAGRLSFNHQLIELRSDDESRLLDLLRSADFPVFELDSAATQANPIPPNTLVLGDDIQQVMTRSPADNLRAQTAAIIRWVESDEYIAFAERVERAHDPTRYTVRIVTTPETRKQMLVSLSRAHGLGLKAAGEFLDRETPLGSNLSALEAADLMAKYAADGISVRVHPPFASP